MTQQWSGSGPAQDGPWQDARAQDGPWQDAPAQDGPWQNGPVGEVPAAPPPVADVPVTDASGPSGTSRPSPFAPPGVPFRPVDQNLAKVRVISACLWLGPLVVVGVVLALWIGVWGWWVGVGVVAALLLWIVLLVPRQVRAMGYCEAEEDLLFRKGILWRSLVVVPYGRMQQIDVEAGPLDRRFGVASVKLSTASAQTDAKIPGLPADEAARLREALTTRGEARLAGL